MPAPRRSAAELVSEHGNTTIADVVVAKIVALATREVDGVYAMGGGTARMMGAVRQRVPGVAASSTQGVAVEVGARQAAADIDLVVEYGVSIPDLANAVRNNVISQVESICGLEVTEVNVGIDDIHLPGEQDSDTSPRVQ
ncbi:Asp23/Gls24 family envelope stress response protein [Trebonia sp.]|uniref:Asp23/Gls24 family envelope stress response protein n=1 Tax=Trebonia sp. TaxID=2767075 RepID=UPI002618A371|nr:Asp23/Gls24 family envelope stress response protein [Trebonia sp.]